MEKVIAKFIGGPNHGEIVPIEQINIDGKIQPPPVYNVQIDYCIEDEPTPINTKRFIYALKENINGECLYNFIGAA